MEDYELINPQAYDELACEAPFSKTYLNHNSHVTARDRYSQFGILRLLFSSGYRVLRFRNL